MTFKIRKLATALIAAAAMGVGSAHAAGITVNDWSLNLTGVDGLGPTVINGIDQITFTGVASAQATVNDGVLSVGDTTRARGLLAGVSFLHNGVVILGTNLNNTYEMTFTFDVGGQVVSTLGPNVNTTHLAGAAAGSTGILDIYIDAFANGFVQADQVTGNGYTDGVKIASFLIDAGLGGVFNVLTFNGSDDAQFHWLSSLPGVILDAPAGNDLGNAALLAVTASQFDADFDNNGTPDVACPTNGSIGGTPAFSPTSFCAQEDGRASLQTAVPEPGSVGLLGIALAGLGLSRRRAHKHT